MLDPMTARVFIFRPIGANVGERGQFKDCFTPRFRDPKFRDR
jgi:hypothetical protein